MIDEKLNQRRAVEYEAIFTHLLDLSPASSTARLLIVLIVSPAVASKLTLKRIWMSFFVCLVIVILFKVALAWLAVAHHQFCLASQANHCDSFQGRARLARLVLLIICSVTLRVPVAVIRSKKRLVFTNRLDTVIKIIRYNT